MNADRVNAKNTKEINLKDLVIEVFLHWRGIIVAVLIGGFMLGGYSVYSSVKVNKEARNAAAIAEEEKTKVLSDQEYYEQELKSIEKRIIELESFLTTKELGDVNLALAYKEQLNIQKEYMSNSILMKVDAYNSPTGSVTLKIIADKVNATILRETYKGLLSSVDMFGEFKEKLGYGSEISELITLSDMNINIDATTEIKEAVLVYSIKALTENDCQILVDAFTEYAKRKSEEYQKTIGAHELIVVDASVSTIFDSDIATKQNTIIQTIGSLESNEAKVYDTLSDNGKEYYDLMVRQKDMESEIAESIERTEVADVVIPPIVVSKKKLLIGIVGGFFVYAFVICLAYMFSRKIKDSDDFSTTFKIDQLGKIYKESKSARRANRLDKAIYSLKRRGRKKVPFDEASSIVAINTSLTASRGGYKKIGLIATDKADVLIGKISEALKDAGVEGVVLSEPLYNEQEMSALKDVDAAVIVAKSGVSLYDDLWDVIEVLDNQKIEILGGIIT